MAPKNDKMQKWRALNPEKARNHSKIYNKIYREKNKHNELFKLKESIRQKAIYENNKKTSINSLTDQGFNSRNSLLKSFKKVKKTLPTSCQKRKEVVAELLKEFPDIASSKKKRTRSLTDSAELAVAFFKRSENFLTMPGKNDTMIVRNKNGEKSKIQKQIFTKSIKEMYEEFIKEYPDAKLSRSRFFQLSPNDILSFTKMPFYSCLCKIHENFKLAFNGIKKYLRNQNIVTYREFYEVYIFNFMINFF